MDIYMEINDLIVFANESDYPLTIMGEIEDKVSKIVLLEDSYQMKNGSLTLDRWPHQSWTEALLGEIFYPCVLRDMKEPPCMLYENSKTRVLLAISSTYKNPLALYHLSQLCANYYCDNKKIVKIAKKMDKFAKERYTSFMKLAIRKGNSYVKAVSAWYLSVPECPILVEEAIKEGDYRLLSYSIKKRDFQTILDSGYYSYEGALVAITRGIPIDESISLCLYYAEKGMTKGYHMAYLRGDRKKEYLIKCLENGYISAYRDALKVLLMDELKDIAKRLNNEYVYYQLAEYRKKLGKKYQVTMRKAGIRGYIYGGASNESRVIEHLDYLSDIVYC